MSSVSDLDSCVPWYIRGVSSRVWYMESGAWWAGIQATPAAPWLSKPTIEEATSASSYEDSPKSAGSILEAELYFCLMEKLDVDMKVS